MKNITAVLICIILVISTGCSSKQITETTTIATEQTRINAETTIPEETEPIQTDTYIPDQVPMAAISLPISTTNEYTEDDILLFTYKCQTISLIIPDSEVEQKVILDVQNRLDSFNASAQEISERAKNDYSAEIPWTNYYYEVLYAPERIDLSVLSLYGENISWVGGAHPTKNCISSNYDLMTGDVLTLGSILTHEDALDTMCQLLIEEVKEIKAEKYLYSDYEDIIQNRFSKNESYNESWYFSTEGLCFYFSPYEIAPYSSGIITITVPYESLTGVIEDRYFPAERDLSNGSVYIKNQNEADLTEFTQIAEVVLDTGSEMVFMYTDRSVQNIEIEIGTIDSNNNFIRNQCVFASPILTPGDAIMLQANLNDDQTIVRVLYNTNETIVTKYVSVAADGSIHLTDK